MLNTIQQRTITTPPIHLFNWKEKELPQIICTHPPIINTTKSKTEFISEEERMIRKMQRDFDKASYEELAAFDLYSLFDEDDDF